MHNIFQLKIFIKGIKPLIWRRFLVSDFWSFHRLHRIIQKIMGWENRHLYRFEINGINIEPPSVDYRPQDEGDVDAKKARIFEYIDSIVEKFSYTYDFGDNWEHEIIVEKIIEENEDYRDFFQKCIEGERACPPEDCGSVQGFEEMIKIRKNKKHLKYKELVINRLGEDYDPEKFDVECVSKKLRRLQNGDRIY